MAAATPATVAAAIASLRQARTRLRSRPDEQVVDVLADVVDAWLGPDSAWFERAVALLPAATGFSAEMIRHALPTMLEPLRRPALAALLRDEARARPGPAIVLHVLPGNLPGLAAIPTALSLAIGSAVLLKAGQGDRVFPALFAASIAERDAELGTCVAPLYWPGGDRGCEEPALAGADLVVASGDDATIADLAARTRGRFIGHGHRLSFAVVTRSIAADSSAATEAAGRLAEDVAIWDQRGCLSPQLCFVEGTLDEAMAFGARLAEALRPLATRLPPAALDVAERHALRRFRDEAAWRRYNGEPSTVLAAGREEDGTVVVEPEIHLRPSPLHRSLRVQPLPDASALVALLRPARAMLEGAGLAASRGSYPEWAECLSACGVHYVAALGDMQRPPLSWPQGGRPRLADWLDEPRT